MKRFSVMLLSAATLAVPAITFPEASAQANDRYAPPPAIVLSPDLSSPWTLQLKKKQTERQVVKKRKSSFWNKKQNTRSRVTTITPPKKQATGIFAIFNNKNSTHTPQQRVVVQQKKQQPSQQASYHRVQPSSASSAATLTTQEYIQRQAAQRPIDPKFLPQNVAYQTSQKPGTIIIDTDTKFLYLVTSDGQARRYGVGVGKEGFEWKGTEHITRKAEWPSWRPPAEMIAREREKGRELPTFMEGGPENPLGARALYLGSTLYRIHGTNQPWTIGQAVSSGCIRMRNEDVMDLYERVKNGAKVIVT